MKNLVVLCMVVLLCTSMVAGKLNFIFAGCFEINSINYLRLLNNYHYFSKLIRKSVLPIIFLNLYTKSPYNSGSDMH